MIDDFKESDCEKFDAGKHSTDHSMIMICISKIRELIVEVNYLSACKIISGDEK